MIKKIVSITTTLAVAVMLLGPSVPAKATTAEDILEDIEALQEQLAALQAQYQDLVGGDEDVEVPAACVGVTFDRALAQGMSGDDVKCLQVLLNQELDPDIAASGAGSDGNETSYFGSITKAGVVRFQEKYQEDVLGPWNLTSGTGYVGSTTRAKLNEILAAGEQEEEEEEEEEEEGEGLTVSLADDNPAAGTLVADSGSGGAQGMVAFLKLKFYNGDSSDVEVTDVDFTRMGISADTDISGAYLYEGDDLSNELAEYSSFTDAVMTFSNSSGLFTVEEGESYYVTLRCDLASGTSSGKTMKFKIASASDITSDASEVNGDFALVGNYMTTATTDDLGTLTVTTSTAPSTTVDPQDDFDIFKFKLAAANQDIEVRKLVFTNIGSTDYNDLQNFRLYDGATQVGDAVEADTDKTITFDWTDSPLEITKGVTKTMYLKADIVSGTDRTFQMSIQNLNDVIAYDSQYGVYVKPNQLDSWTVLKTSASTINTGKLTLTRSSDSPSGSVSLDGTNVTITKFDAKATGEDVKITAIGVKVYGSGMASAADTGLDNGQIYLDGSQKDTTRDLNASGTEAGCGVVNFTFGNTFIIPADGDTHTITVKSDIKDKDATSFGGDEKFTVKFTSVTAKGRDSLATVSPGTVAGYTLSISSGTLSTVRNQSQPNWTTSTPAAVQGENGALVASYIVSAGSGEGADITAVKLTDRNKKNKGFAVMQYLKVYEGDIDTGTQIGDTESSVSKGSTYSFYPSPYISLDAGEQFTLNVYANILTTATSGSRGYIKLSEVDGTGKVTNTSVDYSSSTPGQFVKLANYGQVQVMGDPANNPQAGLVVMGSEDNDFLAAKFSASTSAEAIKIESITVTTTLNKAPVSSLKNITLSGDGLSKSEVSLSNKGRIKFDLSNDPWEIPAYSEKTLTISADINSYTSASSGAHIQLGIASSSYKGAVSGNSTTTGPAAIKDLNPKRQYTYRTKPTVSLVGPSGTLSNGTQDLIEFTVSADDENEVKLRRMAFEVNFFDYSTTTDLYLSGLTLYDKSDLNTALNSHVATSAGGAAASWSSTSKTAANSILGKNDAAGQSSSQFSTTSYVWVYSSSSSDKNLDQISAGGSITYVLRATVHNATQYDSIQTRITDTASTLLTTNDPNGDNAITWSDGTDKKIDSDYVKSIPTGYGSLTK